MATAPTKQLLNDYPTTDGKPVAETDWHRDLMLALIQTLDVWFAKKPLVYVSGNLLIFYLPGNKRKHVAPDVFVVIGVPKGKRPNYLVWEEGKSPSVAIELTSSSTRKEDIDKKFKLYQDVLKVQEYFLFDPREDYLDPSMQGYRLVRGKYAPIRPVLGRLPSKVLGLHLERSGQELRLWNPETGEWLPTAEERADTAEWERDQARVARKRVELERVRDRLARERAEAELARLQREHAELQRRLGDRS